MPAVTVQQTFDLAQAHHQAGRLAEAEALYRQVLGAEPNHAGGWHFLGLIALQRGRCDLAAEWIRKSIVLEPMNAAAYSDLGEVQRTAGRLDEAVEAYRRALEIDPQHVDAHNNLGIALAQRRRFDEATVEFRRAVELRPGFVEAMNNLGTALLEQGQHEESASAYRGAIALRPDSAEAHHNLGKALKQLGQWSEAREAFGRAIQLKPDYADAWNQLGMTWSLEGRLDEAGAAFERAVEMNPNHAEARNNLGSLLKARGQLDRAIESFRRALENKPDSAAIQINLAAAFMEKGRFEEAVEAYRRALELWPESAETWVNLGVALRRDGKPEEAMKAYRRALEVNPGCAEAHNNIGVILVERGEWDAALASFHRVLEILPDSADAYSNLGGALREKGRLDEAVEAYRRATQLNAKLPEPWSNLAITLRDQGQLDEAIAAFRRALELRPDRADLRSNVILTLHLYPDLGSESIAGEERRWNEQFGHPPVLRGHVSERDPGRRLRIGYVSPDFRDHVVGRNLRPLFQNHDRENFEIVCYSGVHRPDDLTEEFRRGAALWREVRGVDDEAMAEMIREDRIDVLVDLSQHAADNRLPVFARKAAPVQVSFAGYPESTGLEAIGYRISDGWLESEMGDGISEMGVRRSEMGWKHERELRTPNSDLRLTERVYLIDSFWCYDPWGMDVQTNELPARENGGITFGSLNSFCKINDPVLKLWARVLVEVAGSRLLILCECGRQRERTREFLEGEGVAPERVEFVGRQSRKSYLELYRRLDIALDPFPYGGHTTCQDALWMGVPVVSLAGRQAVSRAGLSILNHLGLPELVAFSADEYVRIAALLSRDIPGLAELRRTLRGRMEGSVLMDGRRFARNIEEAYRAMWEHWCGGEIDGGGILLGVVGGIGPIGPIGPM
ncbi:MAG TPA: tetratricopeptide repeat protein [Chthoniobacter sp.]|jgi:predicted O-linked N-acetylglucosamine transferase (SPINDLY family)